MRPTALLITTGFALASLLTLGFGSRLSPWDDPSAPHARLVVVEVHDPGPDPFALDLEAFRLAAKPTPAALPVAEIPAVSRPANVTGAVPPRSHRPQHRA